MNEVYPYTQSIIPIININEISNRNRYFLSIGCIYTSCLFATVGIGFIMVEFVKLYNQDSGSVAGLSI